jgi:hypothetical protein
MDAPKQTIAEKPTAAANGAGPNSSDDPLMFLRGAGYISQGFPAPGLRRTVRHITGHDAEGRAVFLSTDCGDHHTIIGEQQALGNILYSTNETPVDMNNDKDLLHAKEHEVSVAMPRFANKTMSLLYINKTHSKLSPHCIIKTAQSCE